MRQIKKCMEKKARKRKCQECGDWFLPFTSFQRWCGASCGAKIAVKKLDKEKDKQEAVRRRVVRDERKKARAKHREQKEALKDRGDWIKEAQAAFNKYVRVRDAGNPCISCGLHESELKINHHIAMVCGHFLSVGAYPELRFEPLNAHLQCTRCNGGAGKYGQFNSKAKTVTQEYESRLIDKIGQESVDWLKGPHEPKKYTIEEIKKIKAKYTRMAKELEDA